MGKRGHGFLSSHFSEFPPQRCYFSLNSFPHKLYNVTLRNKIGPDSIASVKGTRTSKVKLGKARYLSLRKPCNKFKTGMNTGKKKQAKQTMNWIQFSPPLPTSKWGLDFFQNCDWSSHHGDQFSGRKWQLWKVDPKAFSTKSLLLSKPPEITQAKTTHTYTHTLPLSLSPRRGSGRGIFPFRIKAVLLDPSKITFPVISRRNMTPTCKCTQFV